VMSNFKPASDLSRMIVRLTFHAVRIPADLYKVIETCWVYSRLSEGGTTSRGPVVDLWKARLQAARLTAADSAGALLRRHGKIELIAPGFFQIEFTRFLSLGHWKRVCSGSSDSDLHANAIERAYIDAGAARFMAWALAWALRRIATAGWCISRSLESPGSQ